MKLSHDDGASFRFDAQTATLYCEGKWTVHTAQNIIAKVLHLAIPVAQPSDTTIHIDGERIQAMDMAGAFALQKIINNLNKKALSYELCNFNEQQRKLIQLINEQTVQGEEGAKKAADRRAPPTWVEKCGMKSVASYQQFMSFLAFLGEAFVRMWGWARHPKRILWKPLLYTIETTGYRALPIIGLLSFLIGVVLAYQMGVQLRTYGASIFIVNLLGLSILREFAPLMTAIIVAGRSGSAFTAQIGTMQVNEEVDALRAMGISPIEQLALQKIIGLGIALPLLTVWSSITGIFGGMIMAHQLFDISFQSFLKHFVEAISLKQFVIGLVKTPVFALLIASIGCFRGFQVKGSADSVGQQTTLSVVQAIFLVICADAAFSIAFSWYNL